MRVIMVLGLLVMLGVAGYVIPTLYSSWRNSRENTDRIRTGAEDPRARSIRKNHAAMARALDRMLTDEMIYPVLPEDLRQTAQELVSTYYSEGATA